MLKKFKKIDLLMVSMDAITISTYGGRKVVCFVCHDEIFLHGNSCHTLGAVGKLLMSRGALSFIMF
jgi:hypothetical protein